MKRREKLWSKPRSLRARIQLALLRVSLRKILFIEVHSLKPSLNQIVWKVCCSQLITNGIPYLLHGIVIFPYFFPFQRFFLHQRRQSVRKNKKSNSLLLLRFLMRSLCVSLRETRIKIWLKNLTIDTRHFHKSLQKAADDVDKISVRLEVSLGMCNIAG